MTTKKRKSRADGKGRFSNDDRQRSMRPRNSPITNIREVGKNMSVSPRRNAIFHLVNMNDSDSMKSPLPSHKKSRMQVSSPPRSGPYEITPIQGEEMDTSIEEVKADDPMNLGKEQQKFMNVVQRLVTQYFHR